MADDGYPRENFNMEVNGDGAFICMNSWGDDFGDDGYFYVSYYDSNIGLNNIIYTDVKIRIITIITTRQI